MVLKEDVMMNSFLFISPGMLFPTLNPSDFLDPTDLYVPPVSRLADLTVAEANVALLI